MSLATRIFCPPGLRPSSTTGADFGATGTLKLPEVRAVVAIASARGGVGKSIVCINLAAALAIAGRKVAVVDADLNSPGLMGMLGLKPLRRFAAGEDIDPASGPLGLRVTTSAQLAEGEPPVFDFLESDQPSPTPPSQNGAGPLEIDGHGALRRLIGARFGPLDLMLVDLASGVSSLHSLAQVIELNGIVMVTRPSDASVRATQDALKLATQEHLPVLGLIENMVGFNCDSCHAVRPLFPQGGGVPGLAQASAVPILGRLPFDPRLADCADRGALFVREYPDSPLAKQFAAIATNLEQEIARCAARPVSAKQPA